MLEKIITWVLNAVIVLAIITAGGIVGGMIALKGIELYVQYYPMEMTEVAK